LFTILPLLNSLMLILCYNENGVNLCLLHHRKTCKLLYVTYLYRRVSVCVCHAKKGYGSSDIEEMKQLLFITFFWKICGLWICGIWSTNTLGFGLGVPRYWICWCRIPTWHQHIYIKLCHFLKLLRVLTCLCCTWCLCVTVYN